MSKGGADPSAGRPAAAKGSRRPAGEGLAARIPGLVVALAGAGVLSWSLWSGSRPVEGLQRGGEEWLVPESRVEGQAGVAATRPGAASGSDEGGNLAAGAGSPDAGHETAARAQVGSGADSSSPGEVRLVEAGDGGDLLIDINAATAAQFELLPEIGPVMAQRIVDDRAANGAFASVDDLMRVRGIGPKTVEKLRDLVVCGGGG